MKAHYARCAYDKDQFEKWEARAKEEGAKVFQEKAGVTYAGNGWGRRVGLFTHGSGGWVSVNLKELLRKSGVPIHPAGPESFDVEEPRKVCSQCGSSQYDVEMKACNSCGWQDC
jgi:hypothetical protein